MSAPQEFERYPALASWIERLGNSPNGLSLAEWMIFVGALNVALLTARKRADSPVPASNGRTDAEPSTGGEP